jgi:hypothetical protein
LQVLNDSRVWIILGVTLAAVTGVFFISRIPQDPSYHEFADGRAFLGLRNFGNVVSNIVFVIVGALGLRKYGLSKTADLHPSYMLYCGAVIAVGIGSTQYHWDPSSKTLVWDRLPMTVTFMAYLAMVIGDRVSPALGRRTLWPLMVVGIGSVFYWHYTELRGAGDLRLYGLVQFLPIALVVIILCGYRSRYLQSGYLWGSLGMYGIAKLAEHLDGWVYDISGLISGHTFKHLFAGLGVLLVIVGLRDHFPLDEPSNDR